MSVIYQHPKWWHRPLRALGLIDHWMAFWRAVGYWRPSDAPPTKLERLYKAIVPTQKCNCYTCIAWCASVNCGGTCLCSLTNCGCACV